MRAKEICRPVSRSNFFRFYQFRMDCLRNVQLFVVCPWC